MDLALGFSGSVPAFVVREEANSPVGPYLLHGEARHDCPSLPVAVVRRYSFHLMSLPVVLGFVAGDCGSFGLSAACALGVHEFGVAFVVLQGLVPFDGWSLDVSWYFGWMS